MTWAASPWAARPWAAGPEEAASTSHAATGALSAQAATVAGTATHLTLHTSTGALAAQSATVAGTAVHPHIATGALTAQSGTVAGTADHSVPGVNDATGALSAQAATVAGTAAHYTLHTSTGALEAQSASVSGTAVDETTYVPPVPSAPQGGGKSRKTRKRRLQVEIDGEVFDVESEEEAEAVLKKAASVAKGTGTPSREIIGSVNRKSLEAMAREKMEDMNTTDVQAAMRILEGTARSMGITVTD